MKKLGWFALSAIVVLLVLCGVLLLAANLYVQSQGAQERIQQTLTDALHAPVTLKKTTVTPWEGLRIDGISLRSAILTGDDSAPPNITMTADSFRLRTAWWPFVTQRRISVEAILLDQPQLAWAQEHDGRWIWPQSAMPRRRKTASVNAEVVLGEPRPHLPVTTPEQTSQPGAVVEFSADPDTLPTHEPMSASRQIAPLMTAVRKIRVRHGGLDLLNEHRKLVGRFEEVDLDGQIRDASYASGQIRVQRVLHARSGLQLTDFSSKFAYATAEGLSLTQGRASFAGGELSANYRLRTQELGSPFSADCQIKEVDLTRLVQEAGGKVKLMEGRLQGAVSMQGSSDNAENGKATAQVKLIGARIPDLPLLQLVGDMLHIEDLSHLQFKQAELNGQMEDDQLVVESLNLGSNNLQVLAKGRYLVREDRLDLHGRLTIDQAISHQLPEFIEMNFTPCGDEAPGSRYIEFDITGPINKPTTNLVDRIMTGPANGLLQNLLAPKPKKQRLKGAKNEERPRTSATAKEDGNR